MKKVLRLLVINIITIALIFACNSCGKTETDEYKLISEAFAKFVEESDSYTFCSVEKCVSDDGIEYYYFEMELKNDISEKFGIDTTGGILAYNGDGYWEFFHNDILKWGTDSVLITYNELRTAGKSHTLNEEEIKILDERIAEILEKSE